jgi:hypothetical protein
MTLAHRRKHHENRSRDTPLIKAWPHEPSQATAEFAPARPTKSTQNNAEFMGDRETCEPLGAAGEVDDEDADADAKKGSSGGERGARRSAAASGLREMSIIAGSLGLRTLNRRERPDATRRDDGGARERYCRGGGGNKCRVA